MSVRFNVVLSDDRAGDLPADRIPRGAQPLQTHQIAVFNLYCHSDTSHRW